jgi:molybdenum transport protein
VPGRRFVANTTGVSPTQPAEGPVQPSATLSELEKLLTDDVPHGDLTTDLLGIGASRGEMLFSARDAMVLAEVESAGALLQLAGCEVSLQAHSGEQLAKDARILVAHGSAAALLRGWKVAQTMIESWSGVATVARAILDAARSVSPHVAVACTRKTLPGTKSFAVRAVRAGGAVMHRLGLSESVLVFPEHRAFMDREPLADVAARLHRAAPEKKLVIEVKSVADGEAAALAGFDVIQAEKFTVQQVAELAEALDRAPLRPRLAAAGGITADNAAAYARAGADILVTSAPYLAKPRDVAVHVAAVAG